MCAGPANRCSAPVPSTRGPGYRGRTLGARACISRSSHHGSRSRSPTPGRRRTGRRACATLQAMAKAIEYKSASFHVTEGKGLRDEGWEILLDSPATGNELGPCRLQSTTGRAGRGCHVSRRASLCPRVRVAWRVTRRTTPRRRLVVAARVTDTVARSVGGCDDPMQRRRERGARKRHLRERRCEPS
jgi:hypothetical protein